MRAAGRGPDAPAGGEIYKWQPRATTRPGTQRPPLCELRGITKAFPGVLANDGIDLSLYAGRGPRAAG